MTEITYAQQNRKFYFNWITEVFFHPRKAFQEISSRVNPVWITPLLVLSILVIINVLVVGKIKNQAAMMGEITYPPDFQYYTPEQQAQYTQAVQSTRGPVFTYVLPAISSLVGVWLGWLVLGGVLHLVTTLIGGRGSTASSMNVVAWASLPLALRKLIQVIYMLITRKLINNPGLSGFNLTGDSGLIIFFNQFFKLIDIFIIWQILLIILGISISTALKKSKAVVGVLISILVLLLLQAGFSYLLIKLGDLEITRPFFF